MHEATVVPTISREGCPGVAQLLELEIRRHADVTWLGSKVTELHVAVAHGLAGTSWTSSWPVACAHTFVTSSMSVGVQRVQDMLSEERHPFEDVRLSFSTRSGAKDNLDLSHTWPRC